MVTKTHPLTFSDIDVHFNYVFDIGKTINPIDASRKLLKTDIGQAFRNYVTHKSELGNRYNSLSEEYKKAENIETIATELETRPSLFTYLKLIKQDPIHFGKAYLDAFQKAFTETAEKETDQQIEANYKKPLIEFKEWIGQTVTDLLGLLAIHEYVDREIFQSSYLENSSFARVSLQPFGATINNQSILFDVTLTIHRTGIAILTAYGGFTGKFLQKDLIQFQRFPQLSIKDCELPTYVITTYTNLLDGYVLSFGSSREFVRDERGYTRLEKGEVKEFGEIFDAYCFSCKQIILENRFWSLDDLYQKSRSNNWFSYPVIFINAIKPSYATDAKFKESHLDELAKLIMGMDSSSLLKSKAAKDICDEDLSLVDNYSLYLTEGSGTILYYKNPKGEIRKKGEEIESIREELLTSVVVDMILLQKGILQTFNSQLSRATYNLAKLTKLKQEYIYALQEFEAIGISYYGSVHEMIKRGHKTFRINDLRKLFEIKLQGIEGFIQQAEDKNKLRRERIFKVLTTLVAVVFSIPGAQSVVNTILKWPHHAPDAYPDWLRYFYEWIISIFIIHPTTVVIGIYLITIFITITALWYESTTGAKSRNQVISNQNSPKSSEGTTSPIEFNIKGKK
jgi:hypothetical protein